MSETFDESGRVPPCARLPPVLVSERK